MISRGVLISAKCLFCGAACEDRDHLFFDCRFSHKVWREILKLNLISKPIGLWNQELDWAISACKGKSFSVRLLKLGLTAVVYHIWAERNSRNHGEAPKSAETIICKIKWDDSTKVSCMMQLKNSARHMSLCKSWGISLNILR